MGLRIPIVSDIADAAGDAAPALGAAIPFNIMANYGSQFLSSRLQGEANDRSEANSWEMYRIAREDSNTAHQREVKDLVAAGLNPILSNHGGASSAQGTSPSLTAPQVEAPDIMPALTLMQNDRRMKQDYDLQKESLGIQKYSSQTDRLKALASINLMAQQGKLTKIQSKSWHTNPLGFLEEYLRGDDSVFLDNKDREKQQFRDSIKLQKKR